MQFPAKKTRVAFRLPYLSIELFYIGKSAAQIDEQARSSDYKSLRNFLTHGVPVRVREPH